MIFFTITLHKLTLFSSLRLESSALNDNQNSADCLLEGVNPLVAMLAGFNLGRTSLPQSPVSFLSQVISLVISFAIHFPLAFSFKNVWINTSYFYQ